MKISSNLLVSLEQFLTEVLLKKQVEQYNRMDFYIVAGGDGVQNWDL